MIGAVDAILNQRCIRIRVHVLMHFTHFPDDGIVVWADWDREWKRNETSHRLWPTNIAHIFFGKLYARVCYSISIKLHRSKPQTTAFIPLVRSIMEFFSFENTIFSIFIQKTKILLCTKWKIHVSIGKMKKKCERFLSVWVCFEQYSIRQKLNQ